MVKLILALALAHLIIWGLRSLPHLAHRGSTAILRTRDGLIESRRRAKEEAAKPKVVYVKLLREDEDGTGL